MIAACLTAQKHVALGPGFRSFPCSLCANLEADGSGIYRFSESEGRF